MIYFLSTKTEDEERQFFLEKEIDLVQLQSQLHNFNPLQKIFPSFVPFLYFDYHSKYGINSKQH